MVARLVLIFGALLGLGIWLGGLLGVLVPAERQQIQTAQANVVLDRLVSVVNAQHEQLDRLAVSAANRPGLGSALERGMPEVQRLALEADFTSLLPGGYATRLFTIGEAQLEPDAQPPVTFATLDLISRVEAGELPPPESFVQDSTRLIRIARPITYNDQIVGTLLSITDQNQALRHVAGASDLGRVELIQSFDGAKPQTILSLGQGNGERLSRPTRHPYWRLEMQAADSLGLQLGINLAWALGIGALALMVGLIAGLIALELTRRKHQRSLGMLTQFVLASHRTPGLSVPDFEDASFDKAARALCYKTQRGEVDSASEQAPIQTSQPKPTPEPEPEIEPVMEPAQQEAPTPAPELETPPEAQVSQNLPPAPDLAPLEFPSNSFDIETEKAAESTPSSTRAPNAPVDTDVEFSKEGPSVNLSDNFQPDPSMFRAYDVRGITTEGLNAELAYALGKALASEAAEQGQTQVITGGDGRLSTPELKDALNQGILSAGLDVIDIGLIPTPLVYYACATSETQTGIMVTGSHNPKDYNGFKMMIAGTTLAGDEIQGLLKRIQTQNWHTGQGQLHTRDLVDEYLADVQKRIPLTRPGKIVIDCGNGIAGMMAERFFSALGCQVEALYTEVDGHFPNHHPDPSKPENVAELQARVQATGADIGFAFDGDGDRVGVITRAGINVFADKLMMLLGQDVASRNPGAAILYDVKCSRHLGRLIQDAGGKPVMWKTGHSLVKRQMKALDAPLGGEMSGHIFFKENWYGFDDALYTAARVLELVDRKQLDLDQALEDLPSDVSTPEINLSVTDQSKFTIVQALAAQGWFEGGELSEVDGVRVDYSDGFGLVRASNTTPVLVLRFEAANDTALERIRQQFKTQLTLVAPDLSLDF